MKILNLKNKNGITLIALVITIVLNCVCHEKFCKNFGTT